MPPRTSDAKAAPAAPSPSRQRRSAAPSSPAPPHPPPHPPTPRRRRRPPPPRPRGIGLPQLVARRGVVDDAARSRGPRPKRWRERRCERPRPRHSESGGPHPPSRDHELPQAGAPKGRSPEPPRPEDPRPQDSGARPSGGRRRGSRRPPTPGTTPPPPPPPTQPTHRPRPPPPPSRDRAAEPAPATPAGSSSRPPGHARYERDESRRFTQGPATSSPGLADQRGGAVAGLVLVVELLAAYSPLLAVRGSRSKAPHEWTSRGGTNALDDQVGSARSHWSTRGDRDAISPSSR